MSEDYTQKYLKYKNKYLKLKEEFLNRNKQHGGGNNRDDLDQLTATPTQTEVYGRKLINSHLNNNLKQLGGDTHPTTESSHQTSTESSRHSSTESSTESSNSESTLSSDSKSTESTVDSSPIKSEMNETQSLSLSSLKSEN
jgi:hypothetical protein